ncbi:hypothetical protein EBR16_06815 [bacterium]|jgi:hypothetical protein|nr:hypothetical protein [bacterium]
MKPPRKVAVMQPYLLPYLGYFQLVAAVDLFIVYDNIKYTKKGWINRNRLLVEGKDQVFTLPLRSGADAAMVCERRLADDFRPRKLLDQFRGAYRPAPHFGRVFPLLERIFLHPDPNLFGFLHHALVAVCAELGIRTEIRVSSSFGIDHTLRHQEKVLALCAAAGATTYVNAIGGTELYEPAAFAARGLDLRFVRTRPLEYPQFGHPFVPWLSIVDVMMFNPPERVQQLISGHHDLI